MLKLSYTYDALKRLSVRSNSAFKQTYSYRNISSTQTTTQVSSIAYTNGTTGGDFEEFTVTYTYYDDGSIRYISGGGTVKQNASFAYDEQGQMIKANNYYGGYLFYYDTYGNIREVRLFEHPNDTLHSYSYDNENWRDLLTAYDGKALAYEGQTYNSSTGTVSGTPTSGNPTSYYNGTRWTFEWENGRQLVSASKSGTSITYTYDVNGIRSSKAVGSTTYNYLTQNGKVVRQSWRIGSVNERMYAATITIRNPMRSGRTRPWPTMRTAH